MKPHVPPPALVSDLLEAARLAENYAIQGAAELDELRRFRALFLRKLAALLEPYIDLLANRGEPGFELERIGLYLMRGRTWHAVKTPPANRSSRSEREIWPSPLSDAELGERPIHPAAILTNLVDVFSAHADGREGACAEITRDRRRFQAMQVLLEG